MNAVGGVAPELQYDLNDLQIRIERARCEQSNLQDKLDYVIELLLFKPEALAVTKVGAPK